MEKFLEIEKILHFHHTTSRQPLRVAVLRLRCFQNGTPVSQEDIDSILVVWPQAYRMYNSRGNLVIEASDLPHNAHQRRETYAALWKEKENLPHVATPAAAKQVSDSQQRSQRPLLHTSQNSSAQTLGEKREPLQHITKPILMGRLKKEPTNQSLNLLDRIRAKESRLKQERSLPALARTRDTFLRSQVPKLKRVMDDLVESSGQQSLEIEQIMAILRTNLFKLGDDELSRALQLFMQMYPTLCSIVTVGSKTHVRLQKSTPVVC